MPRMIKKQNGVILLISLLVLLFLSIVLGAAMLRSQMQVTEVSYRNSAQEAFYAAEAGLDRAIFELRKNISWIPGQGNDPAIVDEPLTLQKSNTTVNIGFYSLQVEQGGNYQSWDTRWVTATGKDSKKERVRQIKARVIVENPARFLISTVNSLDIISGSTFDADILALDLNFNVNPALSEERRQIHMNGNGYYIRNLNFSKDGAGHSLESSVIFANGKSAQQSQAITFASVDFERYKTLANNLQSQDLGYFTDGRLDVDLGSLDRLRASGSGGSQYSPLLIVASGDIYLHGNYDHNLAIVAGGNIYINGDVVAQQSTDSEQQRPQLGLFAHNDVYIADQLTGTGNNLNVEAFVIADGGRFVAKGAKGSKGTLNFTGAISARGSDRNVASSEKTAVDLNVFATRHYNFNPELTSKRAIPFSPFIVNIVNWQQTK